tara:strand:+ start:1112 stop:1660 length:549 start_codon:yes stop_codon:yes gene_type:complete
VKGTLTNILYLLIGVGLGYLLFYLNRCDSNKKVEPLVVTKTVVDTVVYTIKVEVPKYQTKYITRTDSAYVTVIDSIEKWTNVYIPDTTHIPINQYRDSIITDEYEFDYTIETFGHLIKFDPKFTVYEKRPVIIQNPKPKWMISGAMSQNATFKLGLGYKGVVVEGEFNKKFKQLFIGKQFVF